jgi:hypothetical protein
MKLAVPPTAATNLVRAQHRCAPNAQALNPQAPEIHVFEPSSPAAIRIGSEPTQELTTILDLPHPDDKEGHS